MKSLSVMIILCSLLTVLGHKFSGNEMLTVLGHKFSRKRSIKVYISLESK